MRKRGISKLVSVGRGQLHRTNKSAKKGLSLITLDIRSTEQTRRPHTVNENKEGVMPKCPVS
jgi:hypothetical protein